MKKRELSSFMIRELLYDYVTGHLDPDRRKLIDEEVQKSEEAQKDLVRIKSGLQYFIDLSKTDLSVALTDSVSSKITYLAQIQKTFSIENWPPFVKWTLEAILVISAVILVSLLIPWTQVKEIVMQESRKEVILAEVSKSQSQSEPTDLQAIERAEKGNFEDETTVIAKNDKVELSFAETTKPIASSQTSITAEGKRKGFVYRGTLSVVNVAAGSIKLKDKIVQLGGRKAGEVELGWRRNQGDYYFHFTIPESKFTELEEYFKTLGTIKVSRDPHPRIMPDGIIRLIITAEEMKE